MAKAKAKSKPCAKAKCKGKGKGKGKGRGKGKGFWKGTALALQGLARRQAASRKNARSKCSNKCPDQQWKKIQRSLNSKRSWQASCWTRTWTMEQTLIHWHCQQSLVSMLPVQESPPPHWSLVPILPVHTLVKESPAPRRRSPVSMLPVHTLCLVVPGRTRGNNSASTAIQWDLAGSNIRAKGQWNGTGLVLERISPCAGP